MSKVIPAKTPTPLRQSSASRKSDFSPFRQSQNERSPRKPQLTINPSDSKSSTDKSLITDSSFLKMTPRNLMENLLSGHLLSDLSLDFGNINMLTATESKENLLEESQEEPADELTKLKRELSAKNELISQLRGENLGLRREIEEFILIADKIHANLGEELKRYQAKMSELEQENKDLVAENKFLKEQAQKRFQQRSLGCISLVDNMFSTEPDGQDAQVENRQYEKDEEGSYFNVKEILANMGASNNYIANYNNYYSETLTNRNKTPNTNRNLKEEDKSPKKGLQNKKEIQRTSMSPVRKPNHSVTVSRNSVNSIPKSLTKTIDRKGSLEPNSEKRTNTSHILNSKS